MPKMSPPEEETSAARAVRAALAPKPVPTGSRIKTAPMRTCVACRTERPKRDLVRIVRTPSGDVTLDASGRISGRGAYLCPRPECLKLAVKRRALDRSLGAALPPESLALLEQELADSGRIEPSP